MRKTTEKPKCLTDEEFLAVKRFILNRKDVCSTDLKFADKGNFYDFKCKSFDKNGIDIIYLFWYKKGILTYGYPAYGPIASVKMSEL